MADFLSTDVAVTLNARDRNILGKVRMCYAKLAWTGGPTYHVGGIPMPTAARFGMNSVDALMVYDSCGDGFVYKYDKTNHTLKILAQGVTLSTASAGSETDMPVTPAVGAATAISLTCVAAAGTYGLGPLKELIEDEAPASTTLYVQVWGR